MDSSKQRCVALVTKGYVERRCSRKAGHGPNGEYCQQHIPKSAQVVSKTVYRVAHFRGEWEIMRLGLARNGNVLKQESVARTEPKGTGFGARVYGTRLSVAEEETCRDTLPDAIAYLRERLERRKREITLELEEIGLGISLLYITQNTDLHYTLNKPPDAPQAAPDAEGV